MLAQVERPHNDFMALASYLVHGRTRPTSPDRVAWITAHNLLTDDPLKAAAIMAATAGRSQRCRNAAYHMTINWRPDERPTQEVMQAVATKTLKLAGLAEHQTLVMGHGDRPHAHLHMLINRVHPETGRAWSTSHDYRRFDRIMKLLADEHGFLNVPGHAFAPELTDELPTKPGRKARRAAARGAQTDRPQWSNATAREIGSHVCDDLDRATSWADIEAALALQGLTLEDKGRGLVAGNSTGYVRFSRLGLTLTANGLTKRFGPRRRARPRPARPAPRPIARPLLTVDEVDIARAIGTRDQLRRAVQEAAGRRKARLARAPVMRQLMEELKNTLKASTMMQPPRPRSRPAQRPGKTDTPGPSQSGR